MDSYVPPMSSWASIIPGAAKFHMWHFKPLSMARTPKEQEEGKLLLEHWFQNLKVQTTRWRVPQKI